MFAPAHVALAVCLSVHAQETPLATIPEGLQISTQLVHDSNRGTFVPRLAVVWSPDGKRVAYTATRGDEWLPVVGDQVGAAYDFVSPPVAAGDHVAFQVTRGTSASTVQAWLWVDGRTLEPEDWMSDVRISADGSTLAYWTEPGALLGNTGSGRTKTSHLTIARSTKKGSWKVERGETWRETGLEPPLLSADGSRAVGPALGKKGWVVVSRQGKREIPSDSYGAIEEVALSADGSAVACIAAGQLYFKERRLAKRDSGFCRLAVDDRGKHVAYALESGKQASVGVDGERVAVGPYDHVLALAFDAQGERLAFIANVGGSEDPAIPGNILGGEWFVVVGPVGGKGGFLEGPRFGRVSDLVFDAASERLAYCAREGEGWRVVCGDTRSEPFDHVGRPHFTEAGELGFGALRGRELWWKTL